MKLLLTLAVLLCPVIPSFAQQAPDTLPIPIVRELWNQAVSRVDRVSVEFASTNWTPALGFLGGRQLSAVFLGSVREQSTDTEIWRQIGKSLLLETLNSDTIKSFFRAHTINQLYSVVVSWLARPDGAWDSESPLFQYRAVFQLSGGAPPVLLTKDVALSFVGYSLRSADGTVALTGSSKALIPAPTNATHVRYRTTHGPGTVSAEWGFIDKGKINLPAAQLVLAEDGFIAFEFPPTDGMATVVQLPDPFWGGSPKKVSLVWYDVRTGRRQSWEREPLWLDLKLAYSSRIVQGRLPGTYEIVGWTLKFEIYPDLYTDYITSYSPDLVTWQGSSSGFHLNGGYTIDGERVLWHSASTPLASAGTQFMRARYVGF